MPSDEQQRAPDAVVDVTRLMDDVRERVARKRAEGVYGESREEDLLAEGPRPIEVGAGEPLNRLRAEALVGGRRETMFSHRRFIGPGITFARRGTVKVISPFLTDIVMQINAFHLDVANYLEAVEERLAALEQRLGKVESEIGELRRVVPPPTPWTEDYVRRHTELVSHMLDTPDLLELFAAEAQLPGGYGIGFDERVVEYPWVLAQGPEGRTLDAGSTLNHEHILDRMLPKLTELHIVTLAAEPQSFPERGVTYTYADLRELPYDDRFFDTIISISTLEHVGMDNTRHGAPQTKEADPQAALRRAMAELERVLAPDGTIFATLPYGRREDHDWLRQFSREDVDDFLNVSTASSKTASVYAYTPWGWQRSSLSSAAQARYRDFYADQTPVSDLAAAARAVVCMRLDYKSGSRA
jgi:hypothetical protein